MLPLSIAFFVAGAIVTALWVALEIPVGPGAVTTYVVATPVR
jgi:p-aminobenzoyl-glutamate transporter AbgT